MRKKEKAEARRLRYEGRSIKEIERLMRVNRSSISVWVRDVPLTEEQKIFVRIIIIFLYTIFVWGTVALGVRFSNLSNKGINGRGPYGFIRHPAYASKNIAWWFEHMQYMKGGSNILPLICWNIVYTLRAITEERHLMKDPAYRAYCKKVKYRFIPGLI